jgi:hypothetical protein
MADHRDAGRRGRLPRPDGAGLHPFGPERGELAFGCVTGAFSGGDHDAVAFDWDGNDEMDEAQGDGWAELQPDGSLKGAICFHGGDEANFIARRWTSSTAC